MEETLLNALADAIIKKDQAELEYIIALKDYEKIKAAYKAYKGVKGNDNAPTV